ncbi:hypothetical protein CEXT_174891 [Caerostris extrusa]|uniref:Uncharacterized protein n=1 Tax=Caerostris extrusa TaxID=172846 RepID=A0AAV4U3D2_CAEEX|nr:hypothetical protein CEXT_174891 [Caerostris extrusa]
MCAATAKSILNCKPPAPTTQRELKARLEKGEIRVMHHLPPLPIALVTRRVYKETSRLREAYAHHSNCNNLSGTTRDIFHQLTVFGQGICR